MFCVNLHVCIDDSSEAPHRPIRSFSGVQNFCTTVRVFPRAKFILGAFVDLTDAW